MSKRNKNFASIDTKSPYKPGLLVAMCYDDYSTPYIVVKSRLDKSMILRGLDGKEITTSTKEFVNSQFFRVVTALAQQVAIPQKRKSKLEAPQLKPKAKQLKLEKEKAETKPDWLEDKKPVTDSVLTPSEIQANITATIERNRVNGATIFDAIRKAHHDPAMWQFWVIMPTSPEPPKQDKIF